MILKRFVNVLARRRSGALVLSGLAAVLEGIERLMAVPASAAPSPREQAPALSANEEGRRSNFLSIRRTQSELGFTFWVLQGHGTFSSFELFDTWAEAMAAANARLATAHLEILAAGV